MILSWLKTYALHAALIALGVVTLYAGVQTWRLDSAQDKIGEQRKTIVDVKAANLSNQATIEALRAANSGWAAKCKAEPEKWQSVIADLKKQHELEKKNLTNAPAEREVIYLEARDECAKIPVPAGIVERLKWTR